MSMSLRIKICSFFLLFKLFLSAQSSLKLGAELSANFALPRSGAPGINVFMKWKKHEVYLGFNDCLNWLFPGASPIDALGFETGYKFHFLSAKKRSHFYGELNMQHYAFSFSTGGPFYPYNYENNFVGYPNTSGKNWYLNSSFQIGYETYFLSWLSLTISSGIGLQYDKYSERDYVAPYYPYQIKSELYYIIVPVKMGLRFTIGLNKRKGDF
jgi:hypothetical protein